MTAIKLGELANTIRSKNAGVNQVTFDIIFKNAADYERAAAPEHAEKTARGRPEPRADNERDDVLALLGHFEFSFEVVLAALVTPVAVSRRRYLPLSVSSTRPSRARS